MRSPLPHALEMGRVLHGPMGTSMADGANGKFYMLRERGEKTRLCIIASDGTVGEAGMEWEHVSVSTATRCPTWAEMCQVKDWFWRPDECVMQLHPPESDYVNNHAFCLHLWRPLKADIPRPPSIMVGVRPGERRPLTGLTALMAAAAMGMALGGPR